MNVDTKEVRQMSVREMLDLNTAAGRSLWVPHNPRPKRIGGKQKISYGGPKKPKNADFRHLSRSEKKKLK